MSIFKRKIFAFFKNPLNLPLILLSKDVRVGGLGFVFILENKIIKIRDKKRVKKVENEFNDFELWNLENIEYEKEKFQKLNNKKAVIIDDKLFLEKIDGDSLVNYLEKEEFLVFLEKAIIKLKKIDYHGDFHLDNILVGQNGEIYFIDFEYSYHSRLKGYEKEIDILLLLYELKKQFPKFFKVSVIELKGLIFRHFEKNNLLKAKELIKNYLKDEIDEIFE
ncbi:hypothetical protein [Caminibacter sp.]